YLRPRPEMQQAITALDRVLVIARVSATCAFTIVHSNQVFNEKIVVFPTDRFTWFTTLQSRPHEVWARFFSTTLKDDLQYTPSDCFETFPLPEGFDRSGALEEVGCSYYEFRAALMIENNEGLTKTYNRFHDPGERSPGIL